MDHPAPPPILEGTPVLPASVQLIMNILLRYRHNRQSGMVQIHYKQGEVTTVHETKVLYGEALTPQPTRGH